MIWLAQVFEAKFQYRHWLSMYEPGTETNNMFFKLTESYTEEFVVNLYTRMRQDLGPMFSALDEFDMLAMFVLLTDEERTQVQAKIKAA